MIFEIYAVIHTKAGWAYLVIRDAVTMRAGTVPSTNVPAWQCWVDDCARQQRAAVAASVLLVAARNNTKRLRKP